MDYNLQKIKMQNRLIKHVENNRAEHRLNTAVNSAIRTSF